MALTQDGLALDHVEQARRLCAAGARWIQLRMKTAPIVSVAETAAEVVAICRAQGATCIINDHVDVALEVGADGAHLGRLDLDWQEARRRLGPDRLLGGTVNNAEDAARAVNAGCLDYVGVGPLRFTTTKQKLAPVLGLDGVGRLLALLGNVPAWVIGGVQLADISALRASGATGVAVSQALLHDGRIQENVRAFLDALEADSNVPSR
jgi:thiamine-phosphate pyrophosphorylase